MKLFQGVKYLFACLYIIYSVSPLIADVDMSSFNGIGADREDPVIKILFVENLVSVFMDAEQNSETSDADAADDLFVKRFRSLPGGHSIRKQIDTENHVYKVDLVTASVDDPACSKQYALFHITTHDTVPIPFKGFDTLHSGLAPPSLLV